MDDTVDRIGPATGIGYLVLALGTTAVTTTTSSWFVWTDYALSDLGASGEPTAPIFNGGLILSGLVGVLFAAWLARDGDDLVQRVGAGLLGITMVLRSLIGVFPTGNSLHAPIAISYFVATSIALWTYGAGAYRAGQTRNAAIALVAATLNPAVWLVWSFGGQSFAPGLALPEFFSTLGVLVWVLYASTRPLEWTGTGDAASSS